jgi:hypothetical protein
MWNPLRESERHFRRLYPDLPPNALLVQQVGQNARVDFDEFRRAQWFWERRPGKLILSSHSTMRFLIVCLSLWVISRYICDHSPAVALLREAALASPLVGIVAVFFDVLRYAHWRREYRCAICRLLSSVDR